MGTDAKLKLAKPSVNKLYYDLMKGTEPEPENADYGEDCLGCGKLFFFRPKDLHNRVIKCPYCGHESIFFKNNYAWYEEPTN